MRNFLALSCCLAVLAASCGSLRDQGADEMPRGQAGAPGTVPAPATGAVATNLQTIPIPTVASGPIRIGPPVGLLVLRSLDEYVVPAPAGFSVRVGGTTLALDAAVVGAQWLPDGTLVATRRVGSAFDLIRIARDGKSTTLVAGLASYHAAVGGTWAVVLTANGLAVVDLTGAVPMRQLALQPKSWNGEIAKLSPDGRNLALLNEPRLTLVDVASGVSAQVASDVFAYASPFGWSWSGDALYFGSSLAPATSDGPSTTLLRFDLGSRHTTLAWLGARGWISVPTGTPRGVVFQLIPPGSGKEEASQYFFLANGVSAAVLFQVGGLGLALS